MRSFKKSVFESYKYFLPTMLQQKTVSISFVLFFLCVMVSSCNNKAAKPDDKKIVSSPESIDKQVSESIRQLLAYAIDQNGKIDDSTQLKLTLLVNKFYKEGDYKNVWSQKEKWHPFVDSVLNFIKDAELYGLFPANYESNKLSDIKLVLEKDSVKRMDAVLWSKADLVFTDVLQKLLKDLKYGRLLNDSNIIASDTTIAANRLVNFQQSLFKQASFSVFLDGIQPSQKGYWDLKKEIKKFVDSMDRKTYSYVVYPYKKNDAKDSLFFIKSLQKRLNESDCIELNKTLPDSMQLNTAIKKYQKQMGIKQDGTISKSLLKLLNSSDAEKYNRIVVTLDRYKLLPEKMPEKYIWVNLPGYYLELWDHDTLALESKIICGKPETRTPLLTSEISNMITYPTWTVPTSIIAKQYLPKLKSNSNYLESIGLKLMNEKGEIINPGSINWDKYSKGIPYKVMQSSGDNNALGVIKFNFENPYAVYLHDTNQRYLFKNASRAYSHGCVRVQEWKKLAMYIAKNDSINLKQGDSLRYTTDSINNWLDRKQHKWISVKNKIPLFINYIGCEGKEGKIKFYEDIYGEDKALREKYFLDK